MYSPKERAAIIQSRLIEAFNPENLEIVDESHLHVGHAGAKGGASHFAVSISSQQFANRTQVDQHRMIYKVLSDLIPNEIHALKIQSSSISTK